MHRVWKQIIIIKHTENSNKDASEGENKDRIAERDKPDFIAGAMLQIVCRSLADRLRVICICFIDFSSDSMLFPLKLSGLEEKKCVTDQPMDGPTD